MEDYRTLAEGNIPPWVFRFVKAAGRTISKYDMIRDGEKVIVGISGGKDSLALSLALSLRLKWLPVKYSLKAVMINWTEEPASPAQLDMLGEYFRTLGMEFETIDEPKFSEGFGGDFNCYLCARNRRRILFDKACSEGARLIALGHHLDDIAETTLMNLATRGHFGSMLPVQNFFGGKIAVIRPLAEIRESVISRLTEAYGLPVVKSRCAYEKTNMRARLKPIVADLSRIDRLAREHIFRSLGFDSSPIREGAEAMGDDGAGSDATVTKDK